MLLPCQFSIHGLDGAVSLIGLRHACRGGTWVVIRSLVASYQCAPCRACRPETKRCGSQWPGRSCAGNSSACLPGFRYGLLGLAWLGLELLGPHDGDQAGVDLARRLASRQQRAQQWRQGTSAARDKRGKQQVRQAPRLTFIATEKKVETGLSAPSILQPTQADDQKSQAFGYPNQSHQRRSRPEEQAASSLKAIYLAKPSPFSERAFHY